MSWPDTFELEGALGFLRCRAHSDPSTDEFRVIHSLHHAGGVLVLCRDAGCEVIGEVATDGGRNRVRVDGIDVTPLLERSVKEKPGGTLLVEKLTPPQLITLTAVLDAIVDELFES